MSTAEKLFVQIFERRNWIIEQAKRQTELYNQHLASKLLVDGIIPPAWLWKPTSSADSEELQKDELISQLLYQQPSLRYNGTNYSSNNDTVITGDNKEFCDGIFMGVGYVSPNKHTDLVVPAASDSGHAGCAFNCVPEQILSMTSPEGQADDSFQKFQNAPDNSLARMVRSKSRQKALKLRNSANVLGKSALVHEDAREVLSGGIRLSISSTERTYCKDDLTDLAKQYSISSRGKEAFCLDELCSSSKDKKNGTCSGRITRSGSHLKVPLIGRNSSELRHTESHKKDISALHETNKMGSTCISESEPAGYDNFKLKLPGSASVFGQSDNSGCHIKDREVVCSCKVTQSKNYGKRQICEQDSWKVDSSCNDTLRMDTSVMDPVDNICIGHNEGSLVKATPCNAHIEDMETQGSIILQDYVNLNEKRIAVSNGGMTKCESSSQFRVYVDDTSDLGLHSHSIKSDVSNHHSVSRRSVQQSNVPNEELGFLKSSVKSVDRVTRSKTFCNDLEISEPLNYSQISCHGTNSRSSLLKKFAACDKVQNISTQDMGGEMGCSAFCIANESELCNLAYRCVCSSSDATEQTRKLASFIEQPDAYAFVGPKQLDFNVVTENKSKNFTCSPANQISDGLPEIISNNAENLEETPHDATNLSLENQSPEKTELSDEGRELNRNSFESDVREYLDTLPENHVSVKSEHKRSKCCHDTLQSGIMCQSYEVQDVADVTPNLQFDQVKPGLEPEHGSWDGKHIQKENFPGEVKFEGSVVSHAPRSKKIRKSCSVNSVENLSATSHDYLIGQNETSNPIFVDLDKKMRYPEHESGILSCLCGDVSCQCADFPVENTEPFTISKGTKHGEEHMLKRQFGGIRKGTHVHRQDKDKNYSSNNVNYTSEISQEKQSPVLVNNQQSHCLSLSSKSGDLEPISECMPVFNGLIADSHEDDEVDFAAYEIDFSKLSDPRTALDRAMILAKICRSSSRDTHLSPFCSSEKLRGTLNPFRSLPNGILEHLDLWTSLPFNVDVEKQPGSRKSPVNDMKGVFERSTYSDCLPFSVTQYDWSTRIQLASPVGKLRERLSSSHDGSSEKCSSSNIDLMCFPIEEDPCVSEDGKIEITDDIEEETVSLADCNTRQVLKDLTNTGGNSWVPVAVQNGIMQKDDMNIARPNNNVNGTRDDVQVQLNPKGSYINYIEQREKQASSLVNREVVQSHISPIVADETKKAKRSINNSIRRSRLSGKTSLKRRMQNLALKVSKGNNIVSNISSFIPLVQKTQAANVCAGKRDVKVKSLEAAEVAKRLEEKIVNERRKRKEALKLERAKLEVEHLRKMDLDKKKKEEERKKKDADIIAKKRLIDEEERKEKERKRMRLEARQKQRGKEEKMQAEKVEKGKQHTKIDEKITGKDSCSEFKMEQNQRIWKGGDVALKKSDTKLVPAGIDRCQVGRDTSGAGKSISSAHKSPQSEDLTVQGISYDISPYRSDNENDEDVEQKPSKKYTPWASFLSVDLLGSMLQEMDPDEIFPLESFCSIDEVILSCKL